MSRLPPLDRSKMNQAQARVYDAMVAGPRGRVVGPFLALLHSPGLCDPVQRVGAYIRYESRLPPRLRELAILTVARHWSARFEWYAHAPLAVTEGLPQAVVDALAERREPPLSDAAERAVHAFCNELITAGTVSEETYKAVLDALGIELLVDLVGLVGYYTQLAFVLNAFQVPAPADGPQLPK